MVQANMFIMSFMVYKTQQFSDIQKNVINHKVFLTDKITTYLTACHKERIIK